MSTPQEQIEAIARECVKTLNKDNCTTMPHFSTLGTILTAANRIAAITVRESGAVEAVESARFNLCGSDKGPALLTAEVALLNERNCVMHIDQAREKLRTIINEGTK
jgi:hypothetical protein